MKKNILLLLGAALFTSACGNSEPAGSIQSEEAVQEHVPVAETLPPPPTPEEWRSALESTFGYEVEDDFSGVTEFSACFDDGACNQLAFGSRDAFRKVWHFHPGIRSKIGNRTHLNSYVAVPENGLPKIFLAPHTVSLDGLVDIESVAVMVDGEVVLEQAFDPSDVKTRPILSMAIGERSDFVASQEQIDALRKMKEDSVVVVRINGGDGYVTIDKADGETVRDEVRHLLVIYDRILAATKDKIPPAE